jgi:hypothetical protein
LPKGCAKDWIVPSVNQDVILAVLDDQWSTVTQIRSRIGGAARTVAFASILERMAKAGQIEMTFELTKAIKRGGTKPFKLFFYRRCAGVIRRP